MVAPRRLRTRRGPLAILLFAKYQPHLSGLRPPRHLRGRNHRGVNDDDSSSSGDRNKESETVSSAGYFDPAVFAGIVMRGMAPSFLAAEGHFLRAPSR